MYMYTATFTPLRWVLLVLLANHQVLTTLAQANINGTGSAACQCINPWAGLNLKEGGCHNVTYEGKIQCLPNDYGASACQKWDIAIGACGG
jgi:hypothetical protein